MNIKTTLPATEARKRFFDLVEKVGDTDIAFTITVRGIPKVVLMSAEEYESWVETLDIMRNPKLVKGIEEGKKDLASGRYSTYEEVFGMSPEQALAEGGKKYGARNKRRKKK